MIATQHPSETSAQFALYDAVPEDFLRFGHGEAFDAKRVATLLDLKKADISHLAHVAESSVRFDQSIPSAVKIHLEEIARSINLVAKNFHGDADKTMTWFKTKNPMLGDIAPRDMIRLGKYDRLRRFIINAMMSKNAPP